MTTGADSNYQVVPSKNQLRGTVYNGCVSNDAGTQYFRGGDDVTVVRGRSVPVEYDNTHARGGNNENAKGEEECKGYLSITLALIAAREDGKDGGT
jgi:hypothetical protein